MTRAWPPLLAAALMLGAHRGRAATDAQSFDQIERGRYLVTVADCAACHSDPDRDAPFAGGSKVPTPFGTMLGPNITPDPETGIGRMSDVDFDNVLRRGRMPDGRRVYPAMPYPYYTKMSRDDVLAIRTYLNTVPPVRHAVASNQLRFPFRLRSVLILWDALYFKPGTFAADPSQSAAWNRGAYLVEGPGHCGACHTPKTFLGGDDASRELEGLSLQGWYAPNITNDERTGLGLWSIADIAEYLKRGHNRLAAAAGPMGEEVAYSSDRMRAGDLDAIAVFLKSRTATSAAVPRLAANDPRMLAGAAIYDDLCSACHKPDGSGVPYLFPNIAASASIASREPTSVIRVILQGSQSVATPAEPTAPAMPSFAWQLSDEQVAAVATYVRNSWSHAAAPVTPGDVHTARRSLFGPAAD